MRTYSASTPSNGGAGPDVVARNGGQSSRTRARSLGNFSNPDNSGLSIPGTSRPGTASPDSDVSTPEDGPPPGPGPGGIIFGGGRPFPHSLPVHLFALQGNT